MCVCVFLQGNRETVSGISEFLRMPWCLVLKNEQNGSDSLTHTTENSTDSYLRNATNCDPNIDGMKQYVQPAPPALMSYSY